MSNTIDLCKDSLDKDGENSVYEDEKDMVYIYFTEWIAKEYYQQGKKEVKTKKLKRKHIEGNIVRTIK